LAPGWVLARTGQAESLPYSTFDGRSVPLLD